jgi:toxin FitB
MKPQADPTVLEWMSRYEDGFFLSSITVGEIERGIELLPSGKKKHQLQEKFREFLLIVDERVLAFDLAVARRWAKVIVNAQRKGRKSPVMDSMIEATALHWNLTLATRNISDFSQVETINPWSYRP